MIKMISTETSISSIIRIVIKNNEFHNYLLDITILHQNKNYKTIDT